MPKKLSSQQRAHEQQRNDDDHAGQDGDHRVPQHMAEQHRQLRQPLARAVRT
jgi:hypothetical protein